MRFSDKLAFGQQGESLIACWLRARGWAVLPVYEKEIDTGKGPQLFLPDGVSLIAPDLLAFRRGNRSVYWIEAKHKSVFTWHRNTRRWTTGIDLRHYEHYQQVAELTPWPVWLFFLHTQDHSDTRSEPWPCPTGLYGDLLSRLVANENHRSPLWANGMVYWAKSTLRQIAPLEDVLATADYITAERIMQP